MDSKTRERHPSWTPSPAGHQESENVTLPKAHLSWHPATNPSAPSQLGAVDGQSHQLVKPPPHPHPTTHSRWSNLSQIWLLRKPPLPAFRGQKSKLSGSIEKNTKISLRMFSHCTTLPQQRQETTKLLALCLSPGSEKISKEA